MTEKARRGFASMDRERQRQIASKGGKAAHSKGRAHEFTPGQAREAGRKGGIAVSRDRHHMAAIGRKGGEIVSGDRAHMSEIGRKGGASVSEDRHHMAEIGRGGGQAVSTDREHMAEIGREGGHRRRAEGLVPPKEEPSSQAAGDAAEPDEAEDTPYVHHHASH